MTFTYKFLLFEVVLRPNTPEAFPEYIATHKGISVSTDVDLISSIRPEKVESRVVEYLNSKFDGFCYESDIAEFINHQLGLNTENLFQQSVSWEELTWIQSVMNEYQKYQST